MPYAVRTPGTTPGLFSRISERRFFKLACPSPRPTLVIVPGVTGSQLDAVQSGQGPCPRMTVPRSVYPDISWLENLDCFAHMMSIAYDPKAGKYSNTSGTLMWAAEGGWPDGSDFPLFHMYYQGLWRHLEAAYGYRRGVDLFAAPHDWRLSYDGWEQVGSLNRMAARIAAGVRQNCGRKAVLLGHSMGVNILLQLLRAPRFDAWRRENVAGFVQVGGALSGAGVSAWQTKLTGVIDPLPGVTAQLPAQALAGVTPAPLEAAFFKLSQGLPSAMLLLPAGGAHDPWQVLVRTPSRNYTTADQEALLRAQGDEQGALLLKRNADKTRALVDAGPIPGVEIFCVYGTNIPTPATLVYGQDVPLRRPMARPIAIERTRGDGAMDLRTLRLCSRMAPASNIIELSDPSVDHSAVTREPAGLAGLDRAFARLGLRRGAPPSPAQPISGEQWAKLTGLAVPPLEHPDRLVQTALRMRQEQQQALVAERGKPGVASG